ncbi:MAG: D-alanyl-D-alanine carboxypeptidase [Desulfobulbaceae bacterium]|nr:D-alanyl-D-alanine carboxypeptidase [Desulfobulbaceae bacterium]HIJ77800.1 peptidase S13 [Deltaproteobacteria bacterium]
MHNQKNCLSLNFIKMARLPLIAMLAALLPITGAANVAALSTPERMAKLVDHGGILLEDNGAIIYSHNANRLLMPASIMKIATALAAFEILGPDYRFETRLYLSSDNDLYIKGLGDPLLVSEEVGLIAEKIKAKGVSRVRNLVLDDTAYALTAVADGIGSSLNPYDAVNSGLAVNFNTINIEVSGGRIHSAEEQTPTLPIMGKLAAGLPPGVHRINISADRDQSLIYAGELFGEICRRAGIEVTGSVLSRAVPDGLIPFYRHQSSKGLDDCVEGLLLYSNNFIANQLFLACGAKRFGYPATWDKGQKAVADFFARKMGIGDDRLHFAEGSGLSRKNRVSPAVMLAVLDAFKPHARLLPVHNGAWVKSGTLTGVYSYAGYLKNNDRLLAFAIILNQKRNTRDALLELLKQYAGEKIVD